MANRCLARIFIALVVGAVYPLNAGTLSSASQAAQGEKTFSASDASILLNQINRGLVNRSTGKFLAAFDLGRMDNGQLFKQQVASFIAHTDSIRLHFNLTSAGMDGNQGVATVDVQMEADTGNGGEPLHKEATLNFVARQSGSGWKFVDVQPRSFFSTSPASSGTASAGQ